jgi:PAS domain S-box-containing protein
VLNPQLWAKVVEGMLDGLSVIDATGEQIYVNDALCAMLGFSREELLGARAPYPYWPVEHLPALEETFARFVDGESQNLELVLARKDGTRLDVILSPVTITDPHGAVLARYATIKDISEHKRLERALVESRERWRSVAENPFDFVVIIDRDYRYTYVNHTAPGISSEDLLGRATPFDFVDPEYHGVMRTAFETTFTSGRATSYEVQVPVLDTWYASIVGPVIEQGVVTGVSILTRDISNQKCAEAALERSKQRLRESHRLETLGTLAGGIAHDINNVLTPILACASLAQREMPHDHPIRDYLDTIQLASKRASELVQRILLFSRRQEPHKAPFDLRDVVRDYAALIRASVHSSIQLVVDVPIQPIPVLADRAQLGQVMANLATNALQALQPSGGTLTITLTPSAGRVTLSVADTGPGMDAETRRRAFEPFFTTKPVGEGTGLGLSIVDGVVREHGGEVEVRTAPGEGTVVLVQLPTLSPTLSLPSTASPASGAPNRALRILLVDDEPLVAKMLSKLLSSVGHVVTALTSSHEALETFTRDPGAFDLILTDESMPNMTGLVLIAALRRVQPSAKCLLMTGRPDDEMQRRADALCVPQILAKPLTLDALDEALERATERSGLDLPQSPEGIGSGHTDAGAPPSTSST